MFYIKMLRLDCEVPNDNKLDNEAAVQENIPKY